MYLEHVDTMLFSNANARPVVAAAGSEFPLILLGRFMREDKSEHACRLRELTTEQAIISSDAEVKQGEHIIAYIDEIGRIEGEVVDVDGRRFTLHLRLGEAGRKRLAEKIRWVEAKARGEGVEKRRYERYQPKDARSRIELEDGRSYPCEVIDISVSGASVRSPVMPAIGTLVKLGKTRGRVVRHHSEGFAVEFCRLLPEEVLRAKVR